MTPNWYSEIIQVLQACHLTLILVEINIKLEIMSL